MLLEKIQGSEDVRGLNYDELDQLAEEIRQFLIQKISVTGGHLASNLGVVELTIALYLAFRLPEDKVIWDVGHQSYTHKILSGRREMFDELRQYGGISGFPKRKESPYDCFDTGHSSTSISAGLGMAQGRDLKGEDYSVVSVIGDGALTGGLAYEGLNNAGRLHRNFIVILNDNTMSISKNVGSIARYLTYIRTKPGYIKIKRNLEISFQRLPLLGKPLAALLRHMKARIKKFFYNPTIFDDLGFAYYGPFDGHNIKELTETLESAKLLHKPVLLHVRTYKGKG